MTNSFSDFSSSALATTNQAPTSTALESAYHYPQTRENQASNLSDPVNFPPNYYSPGYFNHNQHNYGNHYTAHIYGTAAGASSGASCEPSSDYYPGVSDYSNPYAIGSNSHNASSSPSSTTLNTPNLDHFSSNSYYSALQTPTCSSIYAAATTTTTDCTYYQQQQQQDQQANQQSSSVACQPSSSSQIQSSNPNQPAGSGSTGERPRPSFASYASSYFSNHNQQLQYAQAAAAAVAASVSGENRAPVSSSSIASVAPSSSSGPAVAVDLPAKGVAEGERGAHRLTLTADSTDQEVARRLRQAQQLLRPLANSSFLQERQRRNEQLAGGPISRRKNATRETTATLKDWLDEHGRNPYPTKGEKIMLSIITKMSLTQVSTWFANARRRMKKENRVIWVAKSGAALQAVAGPRAPGGGGAPAMSSVGVGAGGTGESATASIKYFIHKHQRQIAGSARPMLTLANAACGPAAHAPYLGAPCCRAAGSSAGSSAAEARPME